MNNPLEVYFRHSERVARLLAWLQVALERRDERAADFDNPARLWPMASELCHVEEELISLLRFVSGMTKKEINHALNNGGQDNE